MLAEAMRDPKNTLGPIDALLRSMTIIYERAYEKEAIFSMPGKHP